jgi:hypothetical protein
MDQPPYSSSHFVEDAQKRLIDTAVGALSDARLSWSQVAPLLDAGRAVCRDDLRFGGGQFALHGLAYQGDELAPAEEAYVSITARDRDTQVEWFSDTYWLSDLALADQDPDRVRSAIAAIERSLAKLHAWLEDSESKEADVAADAAGPDIPNADGEQL